MAGDDDEAGTTARQSQQVAFSFEPFDQGVTTWPRWVKRFETALDIFNCPAGKRKNFITHYMGIKTFNTLCDRIYPKTTDELIFDES